MPGILEKIAEIEKEISKTQKNKATTTHLGSLRAKLCALRRELLEPSKAGGGKQPGFEVQRYGDSRVALIGFPSVGKSSLLSALTGVESEVAAYEFTTLTCIPGVINHNDCKIQLLDLPGIIMGAAQGRGRGRQVIACARSSDMIIMVLDATKDDQQRMFLTKELEDVGIRLNKVRPNISFNRTKTGGLKYNATVPNITELSREMVHTILQQYKIFNADVILHEDASVDDFIDVLEEAGTAPRKYCKCLYVYNKIDMLSVEEVDALARQPMSVVISVKSKLNLDGLVDRLWSELDLRRIYTKKKGMFPDFADPMVMTRSRGIGQCTVENAVGMLHKSLLDEFKCAYVWGSSVKGSPQVCGLKHFLEDEDVMQIVKMTQAETVRKMHGKKTGQTVAGSNTQVDEKTKKEKENKKPLKT